MAFRRFALLALAALGSVVGPATADTEASPSPEAIIEHSQTPNFNVKVHTSFPQSEIFGIKLVNGQKTQAVISVENEETEPVNVVFVGGTLWAPDPKTKGETSLVVRNLTSTRYNVEIPAGEKESLNFEFATTMHPQDLRLQLVAVCTLGQGKFFSLNAFNETVSIVEADTSIFDPQMIFLYLLLLGMFAGSSYWIYTTWIATLFPQTARSNKGDRPRKPATKKIDISTGNVSVVGGDGTVVATGAQAYDESWIPAHHLQRPEAKRAKSSGKVKKISKPE